METQLTVPLGLLMVLLSVAGTWATLKLTNSLNSKNIDRLGKEMQDGFQSINNKMEQLKDNQHSLEIQVRNEISDIKIALAKNQKE